MDNSDKQYHQIAQLTTAQSDAPLDRIGYGSCGSIWADSSLFPYIDIYGCNSPSTEPITSVGEEKGVFPIVLKRADGLPDRSLANEAVIHRHILSTLDKFNSDNQQFSASSPAGPRLEGGGNIFTGLISLRNYPLHIDQIEELVLPAEEYAAAMADA